jgi:hypothetical protein
LLLLAAEGYEPRVVATSFLRYKLLLLQARVLSGFKR